MGATIKLNYFRVAAVLALIPSLMIMPKVQLSMGSQFADQLSQKIQVRVQRAFAWSNQKFWDQIVTEIGVQAALLNMDPLLLMAVIENESRFKTDELGGHGEIWLMQIKPDTAEWTSKRFGIAYTGPHSLHDHITNLRLGSAYLGYLKNRFASKEHLYLSAYNMGIKGLTYALRNNRKPVTYMERVHAQYSKYKS